MLTQPKSWNRSAKGVLRTAAAGAVCAAVLIAAGTAVSSGFRSDGPDSDFSDGIALYHRTTLPASVGTVDESDLDEVIFAGGRAKLANSVTTGSAKIRYGLDFSHTGGDFSVDELWIGLRFKDNGPDARVKAKLKAYDWNTGDVTTLLVWNSDDYPSSDSYQSQWVSDFGAALATIDDYHAYYLEVKLIRSGAGGKPEVAIVTSWVHEE